MQLPVHAKLYKDIACLTGLAQCSLVEDVRVHAFQTGRTGHIFGVRGLCNQRVNVVGDLGVTDLVHVMTDLVRDAPAVQAVYIVRVDTARTGLTKRVAGHHRTGLVVVDADIAASREHERTREQTREADVLTGLHGILVGIKRLIGRDDALGLVCQEDQLLPCDNRTVELVCHILGRCVFTAQTGQHLIGRQRQQHAGRCNLGHVSGVGLSCRFIREAQAGNMRLERLDVRREQSLALALALAVPLRRLYVKVRDLGNYIFVCRSIAHLNLDAVGVRAAVLDIQRTAALTRTAVANLAQPDAVAAVVQFVALGGCAGLGILLPLDELDAVAFLYALNVERDGLVGQCRQAERLECRSRLAVLTVCRSGTRGKAGAHVQLAVLLTQQLLCVIQLVEQNLTVYIVSICIVCASAQRINLVLIDTLCQCSVAVVCEQCGDRIVQIAVLIERDFGQAQVARACPLACLDGQRFYRALGELYDEVGIVFALFKGDIGDTLAVDPHVERIKVVAVTLAGLLRVVAQIGHVDEIVHLIFLVKGKGERSALRPGSSDPAGVIIAVVDRLGQLTAAQAPVYIARRIGRAGNNAVVQTVDRRQLGSFDIGQLGCTLRGQRDRAVALAVDTVDLYLVGHVVFQTGDGRGRLVRARQDGKFALALDAILDTAGNRILARLPSDRQQRIARGDRDRVRLVGHAVRLRCCIDDLGLAALPGLTACVGDRRDRKVIGLEVFQISDRVGGLLGLDRAGQLVRARAVVDLISGDVREGIPGQGDLLGACRRLNVLDLYVFNDRLLGHDVLYELDLLNDNRLVILDLDLNGDLLDRYALAERDGDRLAAVIAQLHGKHAVRVAVIEGNLDGIAVDQLGYDRTLFNRVGRRADDGDLLHLDAGLLRRLCQRNGQFQLAAAALGHQRDRLAVVGEQRGHVALLNLDLIALVNRLCNRSGVYDLGRNDRGVEQLCLTGRARRHGDCRQIVDVDLAVAVQVGLAVVGAQLALDDVNVARVDRVVTV